MNRHAPLLLTLLLAACAPPPPPAAPPAPTHAPTPASPPTAASSPLLALVPPAATAVTRVDWKAARASPLYARLLAEGAKLGLINPSKPHCAVLPDAVDEMLIATSGPDRDGTFVVLKHHDEKVLRDCMPDLSTSASDTEPPVAGHPAFTSIRGLLAVFDDGLVVLGNRADLGLALAKGRRSLPMAPIVRGLDLGAGAVLSIYREGPGFYEGATPFALVLEADSAHLALRASATMPSPAAASGLLREATTKRDEIAAKGTPADDEEMRTLRRLIAGARFAADGARVRAEIEVRGGADEQISLVRFLVGMVLAQTLGHPSIPRQPHEP